jgi:site-specific DNA-methyltransferase (adenine-specific)
VILHGDCRDLLPTLEAESVSAIVTDPPYGLSKEPDAAEVLRHWLAGDDYGHRGRGFMGKEWDSFVPGPATWRECFRVLKPGAHLLAFGGTRTYDLLVIALRLAGFEIRDTITWHHATGWPKSLDVSKAIDRAAGAEREVVGQNPNGRSVEPLRYGGANARPNLADNPPVLTAPATDAARQWEGWGTALKPATEMIVAARKPLIGTVAENVQEYGTGALNIDGSRIEGPKPDTTRGAGGRNGRYSELGAQGRVVDDGRGRWPANVLFSCPCEEEHEPGCPVRELDEQSGERTSGASRFYFVAKPSPSERGESHHPTMKPVTLLRYLVRLVTPPGGVVLDPFAGSGTTCVAAQEEGFSWIAIEREAEYVELIRRRTAQQYLFSPEAA